MRLLTGEAENWSEEVDRESKRAIEVFEPLGDHGGIARALQLRGYDQANACRYAESAASFSLAVDHARLAGDSKLEARCAATYALTLMYGPTPALDAIERCEEIVTQLENDRQAQATIFSCLAHLEGMLGEFEKARAHYARSRALLEDLGLLGPAASMALLTGRVETLAGDLHTAEAEFRRGYDSLGELGERLLPLDDRGLLAGVLYEEGRIRGGRAISAHRRGARRRGRHPDAGAPTRPACEARSPARGMENAEALVDDALSAALGHGLHEPAGGSAARPGEIMIRASATTPRGPRSRPPSPRRDANRRFPTRAGPRAAQFPLVDALASLTASSPTARRRRCCRRRTRRRRPSCSRPAVALTLGSFGVGRVGARRATRCSWCRPRSTSWSPIRRIFRSETVEPGRRSRPCRSPSGTA